MTEYRDYPYDSVLAPYIRDYISEKRALGFIYNGKGYQLFRLDKYWIAHGYNDVCITPDRLDEWLRAFPGESRSSHGSRIRTARDLAVYISLHGSPCHVPFINAGRDHPVVHLMDRTELHEFFSEVDSYVPRSISHGDYRMADEYPVIFRLYYCCGMRNDEVCSLRVSDIDMESGIIAVYDGKGHKDRLVYMPEDLRDLLYRYYSSLKQVLGYEPYWMFPSRCPDKHIPKTSIDKKFREFWNMTPSSKNCDKAPTPHSLRHGFVVDRINSWILEGIDINVMFTYLSKYLGHKDPDESYYYYHLVSDAFRIIRQKDKTSDEVIPEVRRR